jgi:hypothetical protein
LFDAVHFEKTLDRFPVRAPAPMPGHVIAREVAAKYGCSVDIARGKRRGSLRNSKAINQAALNETCYRLRTELHWSNRRIGVFCDGRDHGSVFDAIRNHTAGPRAPEPFVADPLGWTSQAIEEFLQGKTEKQIGAIVDRDPKYVRAVLHKQLATFDGDLDSGACGD